MSSSKAEREGVSISYRSTGDGPRGVLFLHGWMMSGAVWNDVLENLSPAGARFVVPDQRGTGASDKPEAGYTIEDYARDAVAVADAAGLKRFAIVGHSMGGQTAQFIAAHHPDRVSALALLNPVPAGGFPLPEEPTAMFRGSGANREAQGHILDAACKQLSAESKAKLVAVAADVSTPCIEQAFDAWTGGGFADALSKIGAPTLVLATDDPFLGPPVLQEHVTGVIAGARQAYLPGPGHYPLVERAAETTAILESFLTGPPA